MLVPNIHLEATNRDWMEMDNAKNCKTIDVGVVSGVDYYILCKDVRNLLPYKDGLVGGTGIRTEF